MITTLAVVCTVLGIILILLGAIRPTAGYIPGGVPAGVALLVTGVVILVVLVLVGSGVTLTTP